MQEIFNTLLVSCIPAVITGIVTYMTASRNAKTQIASLQESNKHEIEKLMKQHEIGIDNLKETHKLELERKQQEHDLKIKEMKIECDNEILKHEKELENQAKYGVMGDLFKGMFNSPELKKRNRKRN